MRREIDREKGREVCSSFRGQQPNENLDPRDWKERIRHKNSCTVFHKRTQSGYSKATPSKVSNSQMLPLNDLKEKLNSRQKYLNGIIQKIVANQQSHRVQMQKVDNYYEQQINELHQMLQQAIEKRRTLQSRVEQIESERSPRQSIESLLLDFR